MLEETRWSLLHEFFFELDSSSVVTWFSNLSADHDAFTMSFGDDKMFMGWEFDVL